MKTAATNTNDLVTTSEAAEKLCLSTDSIKKYCQSGLIRAIKFGHAWMIPVSEIDRYNQERRSAGRPKVEE